MTTNKIVVSRDVQFHEKHFPFHISKSVDIDNYPTEIYLPAVTTCNITDDLLHKDHFTDLPTFITLLF